MANSVPTLTNENWHMFQPSQLETSLATATGNPANPQAFPLMMSARARNEDAGSTYQAQVDQMHATQIAEAMMAQRTARMTAASGMMKSAGETPGMVQALQTGGMIDPGVDLSGIDAGANAKASATNMGTAGRGIGAAAMGGITGLAPAAQSVFGSGADQGPAAIVQAAMVKEAGANGRHASSGAGGALRATLNDEGAVNVTGKMLKGETPEDFKARVGGGVAPLTYIQRAAQARAVRNVGNGGMTSLPPAQQNTPQAAAPTAQAAPAATSTDTAKSQVAAAVQKMLPKIQQTNPAAYADIHAAGAINPVPYRGSWAIQGASGKTYPLGSAQ